MGSLMNFPIPNSYDNRDEDEIQDYWNNICEERLSSKMDIEVIIIDSKIINNTYNIGHDGQYQLVTFKSLEQVDKYEKQECENNNNGMSWTTCKDKFIQFPCKIVCRYSKQDNFAGWSAQYMTIAEYKADLLKCLEQVS